MGTAAERLKMFRKNKNMTQVQFADSIGRTQSSITQLESGKTEISAETLRLLHEKHGLSSDWLLHGVGDMLKAAPGFPGRTETVAPPEYGRPLHGDLTIGDDEFSLVKRLDVSVAAGSGRINYDPQVIGHVMFSNQWLGKMGVVADLAGLVTVSGDSMLPTLTDGALALVDFRPPALESGKVFVCCQDDQVVVKRIFRIQDQGSEGLAIASDNPYYPSVRLFGKDAEGIRLIGRVRATLNPV